METNNCFLYNAIYFDVDKCIVYSSIMLFEIGEQIRRERKRRKLSQADLAGLLGMSRATISQIENGIVQEVGVRKLIRILEVLDLELRVRPAGVPPTLDELREEGDLL
jgi:HTH-type transcriptional regulator / antitoxin HipB